MIKRTIFYVGIAAAIALAVYAYFHFSNSGTDLETPHLTYLPGDAQWIVEYNDHSQFEYDLQNLSTALGICTAGEGYRSILKSLDKEEFEKATMAISNCADPSTTLIVQTGQNLKGLEANGWMCKKQAKGIWSIFNKDVGSANDPALNNLVTYLKPTNKQRVITKENGIYSVHEISEIEGKMHLSGFVLDPGALSGQPAQEVDHRSFAEVLPGSVSSFQWSSMNASDGELKDNELKEHLIFGSKGKKFVALKMKIKTDKANTTFKNSNSKIAAVGNSQWLNDFIPEMKSATYYSLFKDWIICAASQGALEDYANAIDNGNWLSSSYYAELKDNLGMNISSLEYEKMDQGKWKLEQNAFANNDAYYNVVDIYSGEFKSSVASAQTTNTEETETITIVEVSGEPFEFVNHYTKATEWVIQDEDLSLVLMTKERAVIFKKKLDSPVMGEFKMVDALGNNKFQIAFNTENYIYLVDRKGRDVENFPIKLSATASNELAVVDYEKNENYRLLIALENGEVLNYKINGKKVSGWKYNAGTKAIIYHITHLKLGKKDYLFTLNEDYDIQLLDRRGIVRHPLEEQPKGLDSFAFEIFEKNNIQESGIRYQSNGQQVEFVFGKGRS